MCDVLPLKKQRTRQNDCAQSRCFVGSTAPRSSAHVQHAFALLRFERHHRLQKMVVVVVNVVVVVSQKKKHNTHQKRRRRLQHVVARQVLGRRAERHLRFENLQTDIRPFADLHQVVLSTNETKQNKTNSLAPVVRRDQPTLSPRRAAASETAKSRISARQTKMARARTDLERVGAQRHRTRRFVCFEECLSSSSSRVCRFLVSVGFFRLLSLTSASAGANSREIKPI